MQSVKKVLILFLAIFGGVILAVPQTEIGVSNSVVVEGGIIKRSVVLTDENAQIFIEYSKNIIVFEKKLKTRFDGEILPPKKIEIPNKTPKTRMEEIFSFEVRSDSGDELLFKNLTQVLPENEIIRMRIYNPEMLDKTSRPKLVFMIPEEIREFIRKPELWKYLGEKEGWERMGTGGKISSENLFVATLNSTGIYSIIDANPLPTESADDYKINLTEEEIKDIIDHYQQKLDKIQGEEIIDEIDSEIPSFLTEKGTLPFLEEAIETEFSPNSRIIPSLEIIKTNDESLNILKQDQTEFTSEELLENNQNLNQKQIETEKFGNSLEQKLPENAVLPTAGITDKKETKSFFAIILFLSFSILVGIGIFAWRK